jgi:ADP-sugar diphosphatase
VIKNINVQSVVEAQPGNIKFIKIQVTVENNKGEWLPGAVFLRGSSVAMLVNVPYIYKCNLRLKQEKMILQPDDADPASEDNK